MLCFNDSYNIAFVNSECWFMQCQHGNLQPLFKYKAYSQNFLYCKEYKTFFLCRYTVISLVKIEEKQLETVKAFIPLCGRGVPHSFLFS